MDKDGFMVVRDKIQMALHKLYPPNGTMSSPWVEDVWDDKFIYCANGKMYEAPYSIDKDGMAMLSMEKSKEVMKTTTTTYEPIKESMVAEEVSGSNGLKWNVKILEGPISKNRRVYSPAIVSKLAALLEGASAYINHPAPGETERKMDRIVGWYTNLKPVGHNLFGVFNILENSGQPWFPKMVREAASKGKTDIIQLSIFAPAKGRNIKYEDGEPAFLVEDVFAPASADVVAIAGAGGKLLSIAEALKIGQEEYKVDMDKTEKEALVKEVKEVVSSVVPEIVKKVKESMEPTPAVPAVPSIPVAPAPASTPADTRVDKLMAQLESMQRSMLLRESLEASKLPDPLKQKLNRRFAGKAFEADELATAIKDEEDTFAQVVPTISRGHVGIPIPGHAKGIDDPVSAAQTAMDKMLGVYDGKDDGRPIFRGVQEAYKLLSGDLYFDWTDHPEYSILREALPTAAKIVGGGTLTFTNLLGTSMNKRLVAGYKSQDQWWRPFTIVEDLPNVKQQDYIVLNAIGLIPTVSAGAEYTEPTWGEAAESYTPLKKGYVLPVAIEAIINDDVRGLKRIPFEYGRSFSLTLNTLVSGLFTAGSGNGPTLNADSKAVIHTDHNNKGTSALTRSTLDTAIISFLNQTDSASKKLGLRPKYMVIPPALATTAHELLKSAQVPDSANNAVNYHYGTMQVVMDLITTDTNNWYLLTAPEDANVVVMGFYGGQEPQLTLQSNPDTGMVFTNDVINYKIRFFANCQMVDYRGIYGGVVA